MLQLFHVAIVVCCVAVMQSKRKIIIHRDFNGFQVLSLDLVESERVLTLAFFLYAWKYG